MMAGLENDLMDDIGDGIDKAGYQRRELECMDCEEPECLREVIYKERVFWLNGERVKRMVRIGGNCYKLWNKSLRGGFTTRITGFAGEDGIEVLDGVHDWGEQQVGRVMDDAWREMLQRAKEEREERKQLALERMAEYKRKWASGEYLVEWRKKHGPKFFVDKLRELDAQISKNNAKASER